MKTYKKLAKALQALKEFRAQSELNDDNEELRTAIVKHTDWAGLANTINDLESTLLSYGVQKHAK